MNNDNFDVYIYCSGKSGGSTLHKTFKMNEYNSLHIHSKLNYEQSELYLKNNKPIYELIEHSMKSNKCVYIIDSYRNPIERKISSFFHQNLNKNCIDIDILNTQLDEEMIKLENYHSMNELLNHFNIHNFESFDFENKFNILKHKNLTFIKLRFEDIKEWEYILSQIFKKKIVIYNDNLSESKSYFDIYNIIKTTYIIPKNIIDIIIMFDEEFKIYNDIVSQKKYIEYWTSRTSLQKDNNYINIDNFNVELYILYNDDLNHMTKYEAIIHYILHGNKENRKCS